MAEQAAFALATLALLAWLWLALFRGQFWHVRFAPAAPSPMFWPEVVAIVPARDEALVIENALQSLLEQAYEGQFHIVVVDDHSSDRTAALARQTALRLGQCKRLSVITARELPLGWAGKVWAQAEGLRLQVRRFPHARYVWLTDADIRHHPHALHELVARAESGQFALTSLMARLHCVSLAENVLIPAFVFFFAMLYPFAQVNDVKRRTAAAAGGCMLARTDALAAIGGIASIKDALIDDCALAAQMKRAGPIHLDLARDCYSLRPCDDWRSVWNMIARSAYTQLRHSPSLLGLTAVGMVLLYVVPPVLAPFAWPALAAWLLMTGLYVPMLRYYGRAATWAPALPFVAMFYLGATLASAWRHHRGRGGRWKGRTQATVT
ncbi:glycosyltransferase [Massilia solisilvae]|uniref:Glycosyltransferase n=1 Tax=Massilia solisilvae TaxID=1811225 RepID=A0ABT2BKZ2_9BURK|nr:glycosyltransferase [Massilia solisilvae]MCS0608538.1 glycosyltransferase [Massilia solisilvae]